MKDERILDLNHSAWKILEKDLRSNIISIQDPRDRNNEKHYLLAGSKQYRTLWARDLSMSVIGVLSLGEQKAIRDSLSIFFEFQRSDGLLPRVVDYWNIYARVISGILGKPLAFRGKVRGWFVTENKVIAIDGNLILPWAASEYVKRTRDLEFAEKWFPNLERALTFVEKNFMEDGLIGKQPPFSDWADSVRRKGRVAFTNEFYILALQGAGEWAQILNLNQAPDYYFSKAKKVCQKFLEFFWDPKKKRLKNFENDDHFSAEANYLGIAAGILTEAQSYDVMEEIKKTPLWQPIAGRPAWPNYDPQLKSRTIKIVQLENYHDSTFWLWITALAACAELKLNHWESYLRIMNFLSEQIRTDQTIYEVYEPPKVPSSKLLIPLKRLLYHSEAPFTWSASMILQALEQGRNWGDESSQ